MDGRCKLDNGRWSRGWFGWFLAPGGRYPGRPAAVMLGVPILAIAAYRALSAVNAVFEHMNVRIPRRFDQAVSLVWVTPNMHKVHHSRRVAETDSNYGNLLSVFDRLFRTFVPSARAFDVRYGIDGFDGAEARSIAGLLKLPFAVNASRV